MEGVGPSGPLGGKNAVVEADKAFAGGKQKNRAPPVAPSKAVVALTKARLADRFLSWIINELGDNASAPSFSHCAL